MHKKCFFQIGSIKKPVKFFKNGLKKIVFITKCDEKNCLKCITLWKKLSATPKNGNPPPPLDKKIMVHPLCSKSWGESSSVYTKLEPSRSTIYEILNINVSHRNLASMLFESNVEIKRKFDFP